MADTSSPILPDEFSTPGFRFVSYARLEAADSERMRLGRNEPEVCRWSVNQDPVSAEDHRRFVASLQTRTDRRYYAVFTPEGKAIASVNLHATGPSAIERGIWIDAEMRGRGLARKILAELYAYIFAHSGTERIETRVRHGNAGSHRLELRLGAVETGRDDEYVYYEKTRKRRVVLRADAGSRIGFGHFVRTVALAAYLRDDFRCVLVSRNPDEGVPTEYMRGLAAENGITLISVPGKERPEFDPRFLDMLHEDDIVVLDNYYYETEFQAAVRARCHALVCIDDMHDRHFVADLVMTFCPLRREDFSMEAYTEFRGGMQWSFLRAPFLEPVTRARNTAATPVRIAIAMGGADPYRLTDRIVKLVSKVRPDAAITVLAGSTVHVGEETRSRAAVMRNAGAQEIARMFDDADLGIFPASTVCVEAFSRGLPVAAGYYADNQEELYAYGVEHGWFAPLGCLLDDDKALEVRLRRVILDAPLPAPDFGFARRRRDIINLFRNL